MKLIHVAMEALASGTCYFFVRLNAVVKSLFNHCPSYFKTINGSLNRICMQVAISTGRVGFVVLGKSELLIVLVK